MTRDSEDSNSTKIPSATLVAEIRRGLASEGHFVLRGATPIGSLYHLAATLGSVRRIEDIRLGTTHRGAHSPRELGLHTDQHYVDVIAWYCVRPAPTGGATRLVDTAPLLIRRDANERALLSRVIMRCPDVDGLAPPDELPMLKSVNGIDRIYYARWNVAPIPDREVNSAFKRFVADVESAPRIDVTLETGECLFVDNARLLHGRDALPGDSPRVLRRFWITGRTG